MSDFVGKQFGQYNLVSLLGKGRMATVYRVHQASNERDVALKVFEPRLLPMTEFRQDFEREVQIAASLNHPHIIKIVDYGQREDSGYLVTELMVGGSLANLVREGALPLDLSFNIVSQIASALDYAHQKGSVHREVKPQNILLDDFQNAFLSDFGTAKLWVLAHSLSLNEVVLGTPSYMAPEQWQGQTVDRRADVYALGIMFFEMLTGQLPFNAETPLAMCIKHLKEPPPSVRKLRPQVSKGVEQVLVKALAKQAHDRFTSAGKMITALRAAASSNSTAAPANPLNTAKE